MRAGDDLRSGAVPLRHDSSDVLLRCAHRCAACRQRHAHRLQGGAVGQLEILDRDGPRGRSNVVQRCLGDPPRVACCRARGEPVALRGLCFVQVRLGPLRLGQHLGAGVFEHGCLDRRRYDAAGGVGNRVQQIGFRGIVGIRVVREVRRPEVRELRRGVVDHCRGLCGEVAEHQRRGGVPDRHRRLCWGRRSDRSRRHIGGAVGDQETRRGVGHGVHLGSEVDVLRLCQGDALVDQIGGQLDGVGRGWGEESAAVYGNYRDVPDGGVNKIGHIYVL